MNLRFLKVGGLEVAVSKLDEIIARAEALGNVPDGEIRSCLMDGLRKHNYIPREAEEDYAEAIWKAFEQRRHSGPVDSKDPDHGSEAGCDDDFHGIPRAEIDWSPRVDEDKCTGCGACVEFCHRSVFELREGKAEVLRPLMCVVACTGCVSQCPEEAIQFPSLRELNELLKSLRAKHGLEVRPIGGRR